MIAMKRILLAVVLILLIAACSTKRTDGPERYDYRKGTEGLEIEFPVDLPDQIYENDRNLKFLVEVRNKGAFPQIEEDGDFEAYLWIGGYDRDIVDISPDRGISLDAFELEGINQYNEDGGFSTVEFSANVYDLPSGRTHLEQPLIFTVSYLYKTIASPVICIDPEPRSSYIRDKVCEVDETISLSSQGAPIAVTSVQEKVSSEVISFRIHVSNVGRGIVIPEEEIDNDPNEGGYDWRDLDEVKIDDIRAGDLRMSSCRPDIGDRVQLVNGDGYIYCRLDKSLVGNRVYTTPLNIELSYGYAESVKKDIEIFEEIEY
jgi:hypothetical protein